MAWTEVFTDVAWANGDLITATKVEQMVANDRWLRENADFVPLLHLSKATPTVDDSTATSESTYITIEIDGSDTILSTGSYSQGSSWIENSAKDESVSAITDGLHFFSITSNRPDRNSNHRFVKTLAVEFMSVWVRTKLVRDPTTVEAGSDAALYVFHLDVTILGHREAQGW